MNTSMATGMPFRPPSMLLMQPPLRTSPSRRLRNPRRLHPNLLWFPPRLLIHTTQLNPMIPRPQFTAQARGYQLPPALLSVWGVFRGCHCLVGLEDCGKEFDEEGSETH